MSDRSGLSGHARRAAPAPQAVWRSQTDEEPPLDARDRFGQRDPVLERNIQILTVSKR
ncbi:hypothetical protein AIN02nite_19320 [Acetobacter indonesiensis]|uniref:Uncharacterized protein n=1 Tax=Acetobacter indonesiensis TaxID=104101 RepID=A0A6N3T8H5_9PROT|nr:hypothetical protein Abin_024_049 [Acetobacter indonesiensis]GEN03907.1 hypothetical protein AIN02nite_19320 [Acetobacter indonesiensis]